MSLRPQLLTSALTHIATHSFTRPALLHALRSLRPEVSDADSVLDTIFGAGSVGAGKALVERWEEEGRKVMLKQEASDSRAKDGNVGVGVGVGAGVEGLEEVLRRRLNYSSLVGEHLVEAYANLTSPSSSLSIPLPLNILLFPSLPILQTLLSIKTPPLYTPPSPSSSGSSSSGPSPNSASSAINASTLLHFLDDKIRNTSRLPLPVTNPLGPLGYAWRIADHALWVTDGSRRVPGEVKKGYWNEPIGAGPEWYGQRLGLALAYLSAESRLLQPYPATSPSTPSANPHLPDALASLSKNLDRYQSFNKSIENTEHNMGESMGFIDFVGKSWKGLIRSRYW
ncbi:hypothetical protein IAR55_006091 [Kwoniella newhampshirensis]|uniref:COQ9 domain-containing protein n=1 Tax=Kwoniella newhampshirensis TaxID=1651941 RepID=A0AAW0YTX1_9TREE